MIRSMNKPRSLGILAILLFALVLAPSVQSYPTGISGAQDGGCSCHGQTASSEVIPSLEGLPTELEAGATYTLNISFTGGPSFAENANPAALGGFHLWASAGLLSPVDEMVKTNSDGSVTHTGTDKDDSGMGNDQREWQVEWTAPMEGGAKFTLHVNSVNGDGTNGGDLWGRLTAEVGPQPVEQASGLTVLASAILLMVVITLSCVIWVFYRQDPEAFAWERFWPWFSDYVTSTDH